MVKQTQLTDRLCDGEANNVMKVISDFKRFKCFVCV